MKKNYEELIGKKFGMLLIIKPFDIIKGRSRFLCKCDCGNEKVIRRSDLGRTQSCGCLLITKNKKILKEYSLKHGMFKERIYNIWRGIKQRCDNKNLKNYYRYGGRGITYDKKWENFESFYEDMKDGYDDNLTIDRIDNDGNYCKENCRWITTKEQQKNKSDTVKYKGVSLMGYCEKLNISYPAVYTRIQRGVSIDDAISNPIIKRKAKGQKP